MKDSTYTDVTLTTDGHTFYAHKVRIRLLVMNRDTCLHYIVNILTIFVHFLMFFNTGKKYVVIGYFYTIIFLW